MFKYTRAAIDIIIDDVRKYCNIFKFGSMVFTVLYFCYVLYSKSGSFIVNIILLSLFLCYTIFDFVTNKKDFKILRKIVRRSYKIVKFLTRTFTLSIMIYGVYVASNNVSGISIILTTLMIILWVLQVLFELVIEIFEDKKDLIVAGWNKDIENLKRPVTVVGNFIRKVKGEDVEVSDVSSSKEIRILEARINKNKDKISV